MESTKWRDIESAKKLLGLPDEVTKKEIRDAYRARSKEIHPDKNQDCVSDEMARLNKAYKLLMEYADNYKIRLCPTEEGMSDEEWWMHHFGHDPIWTRNDEEK
ncbi:MAG: J domain-containing protein [Dissulfurimicrobium sp.]|uniref:J domain-containing protein n=1 Tax=Dissulfurimicrobium TaxID=1769732 RepID=UPI001EDB5DD9|nr:J domain-containing protein [Dissulfurimicrobium hydrothermale]UKL13553.1 J domain-containing protein [Dissulfurimicrobium hydrothermale]